MIRQLIEMFFGRKGYTYKEPLFDASMMVHFRKRFTSEVMQHINELMYERAYPAEENKPDDKDEPPESGCGNKGILILDATVAPADIKYPIDLGLVNDCGILRH